MSRKQNPSECPSVKRDESGGESGVVVLADMITSALENVKLGRTKDYDQLIQRLANPEIKEVHLQRFLKALTGCSSALTKQYGTLVGTVLNTRWALCGDDTVEEFIEFLTSLLSAQTYYLRACLRIIVKLFLPGMSKDLELINSEELEKKFSNGHEALQAVVKVVPTAPQFLIPVLSENFPYMKKPTVFQVSYIKNLLQISKYLPNLRATILEIVIDQLIKIDVEIPKHELEHGETAIEEEEEEHTQFVVDLDNIAEEESNAESDKKEMCMENEMADKLDVLMEILFSYFHDVTHLNGEHNVDAGTELFNELLVVFENVILPTHASSHTQFVIFLLCSFDQIFADSFLDVCWKKTAEPNTPAILRQACAAYVASFIARAKYIPISTVQTCMDLVAHWIHCYIDVHVARCTGPDASRYGPFYSVCQALFYMFIFRHKQLLELEEGLKYIRRLGMDRIVTCKMNPLKVCLPTVVKMFAHITRHHELVFCYTIIEHNNRMMLPVATTSSSSRAVSNLSFMNQLDSFFPFDPYLLKRSGKFILPIYQEWEGLEHGVEENDDEEEKHSEAEDDGEEYLEYCRSPDATVPGFTPETAMCISPGFTGSSPMRHSHMTAGQDVHITRR